MEKSHDCSSGTDFASLLNTPFEITSCATIWGIHPRPYNCIAFAADDTSNWWDNTENPRTYWPPVGDDPSINGLIAAFRWIGYSVCEPDEVGIGYQMIALYAENGIWTHAATRLSDGRWQSKFGELEDLIHDSADAIPDYGHPGQSSVGQMVQ